MRGERRHVRSHARFAPAATGEAFRRPAPPGGAKPAHAYAGLSLIHVPVYWGPHELAGMGAFGDWNVGNWCERVQAEHHRIGL